MRQSCVTVLEPGGLFSIQLNTTAACPSESVATGSARWGNMEAWGGGERRCRLQDLDGKCAYLKFSKNKLKRSHLFKT